ncbi:hypothetical protein GQ53DRAFT_308304 [Thozetella sp. PMI_491]|nr:hypothetical protein GQ53DRAFT_308304 [Thozetella sp. PMI_491]
MGWLGGWFGSSSSDSDPFRKLDPKLREFLEKESPVKYSKQDTTQSQPAQAPSKTDKPSPAIPEPPAAAPSPADESAVPRGSLYQDGRYAHIWKTYRSQAAVDAETKTDHEKLMDVLDGFKERKAQIGKAALENCAIEQEEWRDCMSNGSVMDRFTMCRETVKKFERCYSQQTRLLKALGYLSTYDRPPEVNEKIQMHADKLYHRMLEQEVAMEAAKKEGLPAPQFAPMFDKPKPAVDGVPDAADPVNMSADAQKQWKARLEKVEEEDRPAEEEAMKAELRAKAEMARRVQGIWDEQARARDARKAEGQETTMDKVSAWFGGRK